MCSRDAIRPQPFIVVANLFYRSLQFRSLLDIFESGFVWLSNLCEKLSCSSKRSPTFPNSHFSIHQKRHNAMWCLLHSTPFMSFSSDVVCVNTVPVVDEFRPRACGTWSTFHGTNKLRFAEVFCTKCFQLYNSVFHEQNLINIWLLGCCCEEVSSHILKACT